MNKKNRLFKSVLLGVLMSATIGFVGCKDYDAPIDDLRTQVNQLKTENGKEIKALQGQIAAQQSALDAAKADLEAKLKGKVSAEEVAALKASLEIVNAEIAKLNALAETVATKVELDALKELLDGKADQATIDEAVAKMQAALDKVTTDNTELVAELKEAIAAGKAYTDAAIAKINETLKALLGDGYEGKTLEEIVKAIIAGSGTTTPVVVATIQSLTAAGLPLEKGTPVFDMNAYQYKKGTETIALEYSEEIKFQVNPSNANLDGVSFAFNVYKQEFKSATAPLAIAATMKDFKDGILTLGLAATGENKLKGKERNFAALEAIYAGGAKVTASPVIVDRKTFNVAPVLKGKKDVIISMETDLAKAMTSATTFAIDAKQATDFNTIAVPGTTAKTEIPTAYAEQMGLTISIDMNDDKGKAIKYLEGGLDQQKYITIEDGVITPKKGGLTAGKTPIVRVTMMKGDEVISTNFVKLTLGTTTESASFEYDYKGDIDLNCTDFNVILDYAFMVETVADQSELSEAQVFMLDGKTVQGTTSAVAAIKTATDKKTGKNTFGITIPIASLTADAKTGKESVVLELSGGSTSIKINLDMSIDKLDVSLAGLAQKGKFVGNVTKHTASSENFYNLSTVKFTDLFKASELKVGNKIVSVTGTSGFKPSFTEAQAKQWYNSLNADASEYDFSFNSASPGDISCVEKSSGLTVSLLTITATDVILNTSAIVVADALAAGSLKVPVSVTAGTICGLTSPTVKGSEFVIEFLNPVKATANKFKAADGKFYPCTIGGTTAPELKNIVNFFSMSDNFNNSLFKLKYNADGTLAGYENALHASYGILSITIDNTELEKSGVKFTVNGGVAFNLSTPADFATKNVLAVSGSAILSQTGTVIYNLPVIIAHGNGTTKVVVPVSVVK